MTVITRRGSHHQHTVGLLIVLSLCVAGGLVLVTPAQAGSRQARAAPPAAPARATGAGYAAGEVLVRLRAGASVSGKRALASALGAVEFRDLRLRAVLPPGQRMVLIRSTTLSGEALVRSALRDPSVAAASLNYRIRGTGAPVYPDDPSFPKLWGLNNTGQTGGLAGADVGAPWAWSTTTGSPGVVIAVLDSGVAYDHPDLAANMWHNPGEIPANGIDDDGNGYVDDIFGIDAFYVDGDPYDDHGHGTHVAGIAAAVGDNGIGVSGVAWQARIMALKFLNARNEGYDADAIVCIDYAVHEKLEHGVSVVAINASWGETDYDVLLRDTVDAAGAAGIVFCAAAGNGGDDEIGDDNDATPYYPASYDCANIISVAATDDHDAPAGFSNYGATSVDLAAPGVSILSTALNGGLGQGPGYGYSGWSGTSMAAPFVSGAVALCAAQYPSETVAERVRRILDHVHPLAALSDKTVTGGRLDVAAAVTPDIQVPAVTTFLPAVGPPGTAVAITGTGFGGATAVAFNGAAATLFNVIGATQVAATVPVGATSGPVSVTTPGGTAASAVDFTVTTPPAVPRITTIKDRKSVV